MEPLDPERVPQTLRPLVALAERWNIGDDYDRERRVDEAPRVELEELVLALKAADSDALEAWLAGPEAKAPRPSREYVAFTLLTMAADAARVRLDRS